MTQVVRDRKLSIHYTVPGRVAQTELFGSNPFELELPDVVYHSIKSTRTYKLKTDGPNGYILTSNEH